MNCEKCVHKISIPGNCHIGCNNPNAVIEGTRNQWNHHPLNFDPVWINSCTGYSESETDRLPVKQDPLVDLMRLFM